MYFYGVYDMKFFWPRYCEKFKCTADKCTHSCCIGWEIDVDEDALRRYTGLGDLGKEILSTVDFSGDVPHFILKDSGRCPHLRGDGLCRIICESSEEYLCDICREHPRFYNMTARGCEVGIGASCEAAAALILSSDSYFDIIPTGKEEEMDAPCHTYDVSKARASVYKILSDRAAPYSQRLSRIYSEFSVTPKILGDEEWHAVLSELEYLSEDSRELFLSYGSEISDKASVYSERALAYFIYRHTGVAESDEEFCALLGFALFLERLFTSISQRAESDDDFVRLLVRLSEEIEYSEDNSDRIKSEFMFI